MKILFRLALRNLFRNKRRTLITCSVMTIGLAGLIFADAFLLGLVDTMIRSATGTFLGDFQIHRESGSRISIDKTIINQNELEKNLNNQSDISSFSRRIVVQGMASAAENSSPVMIYGVYPSEEASTSLIFSLIQKGQALSNEYNTENEILIGEKLAKNLDITVGDNLVLISSGANDTGMTQAMFRVQGIFNSETRRLDQNVVFIHSLAARSFFKMEPNSYHEVSIKVKKPEIRNHPDLFQFSIQENVLESWRQLIPALDAGINVTNFSRLIYSIVLFFLTLLTVINTIFMSIYERMYEMGVVKSIGMRSRLVFSLIAMESMILGVLSAFFGALLGFILILITKKTGVYYGHIEYFGATIRESIVPLFSKTQFFIYPFFIIFVSLIASLYPARYASRINPIKAMRRN